MATVANKVRVAGPDLEAAEEARRRFEQGLVPNVQAPNPTRSVDGVEPVVEEIALAPESLDNTPEPTPEALYLPRRSTDWQARLNEARARGDELRQGAGIQRTGSDINAAFVRAIGSTPRPPSDELEKLSALPETRVKEDMALEQAGLKRQKDLDSQDPNSPANRAFRDSIRSKYKTFAAALGPAFEQMTQSQIEKLFGADVKQQQTDNAARNAEARIAQAQAQQDFNQNKFDVDQRNWQTKFDADEAFRREQNAIAWTNATRRAEELAMYGGMTGVDLRNLKNSLAKVSEESKPLSEVTAGLENIEKMIPGITDGKLTNKKLILSPQDKLVARVPGGTNMLSTEKQRLLKAAEDLKNLVVGARSGLTVTEQEREQYRSQFGERTFDDAQILANALLWYKGLIYKKLRDTQAGFAPVGNPALDRMQPLPYFEQVDGSPISFRDPFFRSVGGPGNRLQPDPEKGRVPGPTSTPVPSAPTQTPSPAPAATTQNKPAQDAQGRYFMWSDTKQPVMVRPERLQSALDLKFEYRQPNQKTYGQ